MTLDEVKGGGTVERTVQMSRYLAAAGAECEILTTAAPGEPLREVPGVKVTAVECLWRRFYLPTGSSRLIEAAVGRADIVHIMNHWAPLNAMVYKAARKLKKPYVVCPAGALPIFGRSKLLKLLYNLFVGKRLIRNAAHCIAITPIEVDHFLQYGAVRENISVIPNGIDTDAHKVRKPYKLPVPAPYLAFVGRLNPIKGPDLLMEAFCALKDQLPYSLVFMGPDNGMQASLETAAEAAGVKDRVHFAGFVELGEKSELLAGCDFLVIPSRLEAMSIVVLEAAMASKPVLLTDQCGFDEVQEQGGGLVVPATAEGLKEGLKKMNALGGELPAMGVKLNRFVKSRYAWEAIARTILELYGRLTPGV
jgi:glycosyltransferase involved in cell wall biosynthesis